ncbi:MAG: TadE/TadG family type IV pilus assembly protein [Agromyces sp.]
MRARVLRGDRGAAAVEFALIVPLLIFLLFGIIEASRLYNAQISITNSAREAARFTAVHSGVALADIQAQAVGAAPSLTPALTAAQVAVGYVDSSGVTTTSCGSGGNVIVTISYPYSFLFGLLNTNGAITLTGKAMMQCGG